MRDQNVIIAAVAEKVHQCWAGKKKETFDFVTFVEHAKKLDLRKPSSETVLLKPILKGNGDYRWVFQLDTLEAARNGLLLQIVTRMTTLHPRQFIRGGGIPALEAWLQNSLDGSSSVT